MILPFQGEEPISRVAFPERLFRSSHRWSTSWARDWRTRSIHPILTLNANGGLRPVHTRLKSHYYRLSTRSIFQLCHVHVLYPWRDPTIAQTGPTAHSPSTVDLRLVHHVSGFLIVRTINQCTMDAHLVPVIALVLMWLSSLKLDPKLSLLSSSAAFSWIPRALPNFGSNFSSSSSCAGAARHTERGGGEGGKWFGIQTIYN